MRRMRMVLAPMQDVTDLAFMRTLTRIGSLPDVFVTPYFRDEGDAILQHRSYRIVHQRAKRRFTSRLVGT